MRGIENYRILCKTCSFVNTKSICERCGEINEPRNYDGISKCKAYLLAALIFYLPANFFPIMTVIKFGKGEPDTILSGVIDLIRLEMYPIAIVVFAASIAVPIFKILSLWYIISKINTNDIKEKRKLTKLYRVVHFVGKWSMLDIFVIGLLAMLVQFGFISQVRAEPAILYFTAVVILTIFAAKEIDIRILWDNTRDKEGQDV